MQIVVEIPTHDEWIEQSSGVLPKDREICVIIHRYGHNTPGIVQFRKADELFDGTHDYFLCIDEMFYYAGLGVDVKSDSDFQLSFCPLGIVRYWKPLNLPKEIDRKLQETIDDWLDGDDEVQGVEL